MFQILCRAVKSCGMWVLYCDVGFTTRTYMCVLVFVHQNLGCSGVEVRWRDGSVGMERGWCDVLESRHYIAMMNGIGVAL
jgi:hypothetical protein